MLPSVAPNGSTSTIRSGQNCGLRLSGFLPAAIASAAGLYSQVIIKTFPFGNGSMS